ncbi:winged helix-turn-helix domain-containing protein [Streptomyces prasinosporus]|uniref:Winged helix-turn-helix domain-containing protein n=1 Tax=Streptomyces prasinosporus TaxID=68256 RepID=A0ABP6U6P3_9ACTN
MGRLPRIPAPTGERSTDFCQVLELRLGSQSTGLSKRRSQDWVASRHLLTEREPHLTILPASAKPFTTEGRDEMLRFHFTPEDLARTRVAEALHPMWEIASSLHRFQTREGRWAYAHWHRAASAHIREAGIGRTVRSFLLPLFPRAVYFPDFLTPTEGIEGLKASLDAILAAPRQQVAKEANLLDGAIKSPGAAKTPKWVFRLDESDMRSQLVSALHSYHQAVIAPHEDHINESLQAERIRHARTLLNAGTEGLLSHLTPTIRWRYPVLEITSYPERRDVHLNGKGLLLIPSYFCWKDPIALADPGLPPVIVYPLHHIAAPSTDNGRQPLSALLGCTRAAILQATVIGATTTEAARRAGVSTGTATHHTTALRNAGLISSNRYANTVLHTLTPLGADLLAATKDRSATSSASRPSPA